MSHLIDLPDVVVRKLEERDLTKIWEIERSVYEDPWSENLIHESLMAPLTHTMGVFQKGEPIAYAIFQVIFAEGHLLNFAVAKEAQRQGLGKFLLIEVLKEARSKGADAIYLEVRPSNTVARKLYEKNGFRVLMTREKYYSNGESALVMICENLLAVPPKITIG